MHHFLIIICFFASNFQMVGALNILNESELFEAISCAGKNMTATCCKSNEKMIVNSTKAGVSANNTCINSDSCRVQPRNCRDCCNVSTDCCSFTNDSILSRRCTWRSECNAIPEQSNIPCVNALSPLVNSSFYSIQYYCIEDSRFGECNSTVLRTCKNGQTLYLTSPEYPNNVSKPVKCSCGISTDCNQTIEIVKVDLQISGKEYIVFNDSTGSQFNKRGDMIYSISEQYSSKTNLILFQSSLETGNFIFAIKAGCALTIRCPHDAAISSSDCNTINSNDASGFPWYAIVIPVLFIAIACTIIVIICKCCKKNNVAEVPNEKPSTVSADIVSLSEQDQSDGENVNDLTDHDSELFMSSTIGLYTSAAPISVQLNGIKKHNQLNPLPDKEKKKKTKKKKKKKKKQKENDPKENINEENEDKDNVNENTDEKNKKKKKKKKHSKRDKEINSGVLNTVLDFQHDVNGNEKDS